MAIDNLNFYTAGMPAGQLTDKYSSQPGCLKSKNLDIFSSSKSVKGTAFSQPVARDGDVIVEEGGLVLKTDGKVYERTALGDTLIVDPSVNFPVCQVCYEGENGTYTDGQRGTPQTMSVKTEGGERKAFEVFTDRACFLYSNAWKTFKKEVSLSDMTMTSGVTANGYEFSSDTVTGNKIGIIQIRDSQMSSIPLRIYCTEPDTTDVTLWLDYIEVDFAKNDYYYDAEIDSMVHKRGSNRRIPFTGTIQEGIFVNVPINVPIDGYTYCRIILNFQRTRRAGKTGNSRSGGKMYIDVNGGPDENHRMTVNGVTLEGDYKDMYGYLPIADRQLQPVGEYYWMKGKTYQPLYERSYDWVKNTLGQSIPRYDFVGYMGWENNVSMDIISMIVRNEKVYMIGNMNGNGYIIPCDLTGGRGTPYIAYGCEFKGAINLDYLLYLVGTDRGVSQFWVFNAQELVPIVGGNRESDSKDVVGVDEQYQFDGKMVEYRGNIVLSTEDGRIYEYGQTYGGKGGAFIHKLPENAVITGLVAKGDDLIVKYSITTTTGGVTTTTNYSITYQDDTPMKRYNTEREAVFPIVLGNHLLEKEESDLYASFILPSANTSLEFRGMANHYHFWTFTSEDNQTLSESENYKLKGASGNYALKFIERNGNQYTFRLEGDLPVQTGDDMQIIDSNNAVVINYSDFNHFRKIGEITTDKYLEGEFRFHNLNNKLELPKSHSLQIMVKGNGTTQYSPELFAVDLVANQRERG